MSKIAILVAGGTGGHLFPAQALGEELRSRGYRVQLMTDERVRDYGKNFPAEQVHIIPSATLSLSDPLRIPSRGFRLLRGIMAARGVLRTVKPSIVAGFGGYPSFPPLMAASMLKIPTLLHEQNSVLGRANAFLAKRATRIALSFPSTKGLKPDGRRIVVTGNPVRSMVLPFHGSAYPELNSSSPLKLVVFGGSQGAKFFSDFMPGAFAAMHPDLRRRITLTQQCRAEDLDRVKQQYANLGINADLAAFFNNLPERIAGCHLVICRSGASTIAELAAIGRPAVMVPLPHSIDNDQLHNAESLAAGGGGWVQPQSSLTPESFAAFLTQLMMSETVLPNAASAALRHGRPDAAQRLADLAESLMRSGKHNQEHSSL
jgi:UDP-N-acetylglucosamine--N-acetylmuramyl-(pentapeptide) pyrophosphoryl-undecaprenol N-acetylglucosamine transferase